MTAWLALLRQPVGDLAAPATDGDRHIGWLCAWCGSTDRPHPSALRVDGRLLAADGPPCRVSLLLLPADARPIADDPAAVHARRCVLRDGRPAAVSILTDDPVHLAGALTVARIDHQQEVAALADDPFARLGPTLILDIGAGVLGPSLLALGPVIERYAGAPWPCDQW